MEDDGLECGVDSGGRMPMKKRSKAVPKSEPKPKKKRVPYAPPAGGVRG